MVRAVILRAGLRRLRRPTDVLRLRLRRFGLATYAFLRRLRTVVFLRRLRRRGFTSNISLITFSFSCRLFRFPEKYISRR